MAVTSVPWVHMFTCGSVWAMPRNPAPTKDMMALPTAHFRAIWFGCLRSPFLAIAKA